MSLDDSMKVSDLKNIVDDFCDRRDWKRYHNAKDLAIGITTESAELLDIFRFKSIEETEEFFKDEEKSKMITSELSDVLFFVLRFASLNNIDLSCELMKKMEVNEKKYPVEKFRGSNKKYYEK
jgi:NTP pyrophosphatase (non-canonical NTP hydrolase)